MSRRILASWIIICLCVIAWIWCCRRLGHRRFLPLLSLLAGSLIAEWLVPTRYASFIAAVFLAAFMITLIELGQGLRRGLFESGAAVRFNSRLFRRAAAAAVTATLLALVFARLASGQPVAPPERGSRVLAFFPYEGSFDPDPAGQECDPPPRGFRSALAPGGRGRLAARADRCERFPPSHTIDEAERSDGDRRERDRADGLGSGTIHMANPCRVRATSKRRWTGSANPIRSSPGA